MRALPLPVVKAADGGHCRCRWYSGLRREGPAADGGRCRCQWWRRTAWGGRCRGRRALPLPVLTADGVGRALERSDGKISTSGAGEIAWLNSGVGESLLGQLVVRRELR